jgi:hypothetical protein
MKEQTKCYSVNLTKEQEDKLNSIKETCGKSKSHILSESIETGLKKSFLESKYKKMFLVKVRIDSNRVMEMGLKLQNGELDKTNLLFTYCLKYDFTVGVNLWMAEDRDHFDKIFSPHKQYYKEILEIEEVILPQEALELILKK